MNLKTCFSHRTIYRAAGRAIPFLVLLALLLALMLPAGALLASPPMQTQSGNPGQGSASDAVGDADNLFLETINVLVLGADRRNSATSNWRTDVMMVIALDTENGQVGVISLPRDLYVEEIPGYRANRINVIDYLGEKDDPGAGGGPELLGGILEEQMGIPIDHYVRFDFGSFREVVDALNGVEVDVDCGFVGFQPSYGWLRLEPGTHRLTGKQSLIYVRDRKNSGGDLDRARRQQRFVWSVRNQILKENVVKRLPALYSALSDSVDTDMGLIQALRVARIAVGADLEDIHGFVVKPPNMLEQGWRNGMWVFLPDWDLIAENARGVFDDESFDRTSTPGKCKE